jgi:gamma-glutamyltranspeptidase/glutathione hydrolase
MIKSSFVICVLTALLGGCSSLPPEHHFASGRAAPIEPEGSSGYIEKNGWIAQRFMVAAANPLAVDAGYQMLKAGGSALDAAIATQMVLGLVEPQSSGIGGGAFMLYFDGAKVEAFDGRETAPASVDENLFLKADGKAMPFHQAVVGGLSVGVPGVLRMLELAHRQYGKLPWQVLFEPAIQLARDGFSVSPRLAILLESETYLKTDPVAATYFYDTHGRPRPVGYLLKNPALADTLQIIATQGADAFLQRKNCAGHSAQGQPASDQSGQIDGAGSSRLQGKNSHCDLQRLSRMDGVRHATAFFRAALRLRRCWAYWKRKTCRPLLPSTASGARMPCICLLKQGGWLTQTAIVISPTRIFVPLPRNGVAALLDKKYLAQRAALIGEKINGTRDCRHAVSQQQLAWGTDTSPRIAGDLAYLHRRWQRPRAGDDHHDRKRLRLAADGRRVFY